MAREILFKAKRIDNGEWVEGLLWKKKYQSNKWYISCFPDKDDNEEVYVIDSNTICQYTGLTDMNGNKIWENDVCKVYLEIPFLQNKQKLVNDVGVVSFDVEESRYYINSIQGKQYALAFVTEVIGNIFDNPELLGGADNG